MASRGEGPTVRPGCGYMRLLFRITDPQQRSSDIKTSTRPAPLADKIKTLL